MGRRLAALATLLALSLLAAPGWASSSPQVTVVGDVIALRAGHTATALVDHRVLFAGGANSGGVLASAELFDPATGTFSAAGAMSDPRQGHTATRLPDGRVLVAGGANESWALDSAEIYDPSAGTFEPVAPMNAARSGHSATLLANGVVLLAGGDGEGSAEIYDPGVPGFVALPASLTAARAGHSASLLSDGTVLIAGGTDTLGEALDTVELYDPTTPAFTALPYPMFWARTGLADAVTAGGDVVLVGGDTLGSAEIFATADRSSRQLALSLGAPDATVTRLANEKMLLIGRDGAILFDPTPVQFEDFAGSTTLARQGHSATITAEGKVLVGFGRDGQGAYLSTASLFNPVWIATDANDYSPGATAFIVAGGFLAREAVEVHVVHADGTPIAGGQEAPWQVPSDEYGTVVTAWPVCIEDCIGAELEVSAVGQTSGLAARTRFTDKNECNGDTDCDDGNPCTVDACGGSSPNKVCTHTVGNAAVVCRPAAGECDLPETCTGTSATCPPADVKKASGTTCSDEGNPCTVDQCNGTSVTCQHTAGNAGAVCRAAADECDLPETCTGTSTTCPADSKKTSGTVCTDDGNACTLDQCNGSANTCQHPAGNAGAVCRAAAGVCDVAETCTGTNTTCPADAKSTALCRAASGVCDAAEFCDGSANTCPADRFQPASVVCRAASGECDAAETCTGTGPGCPADAVNPADEACTDDGNACTRDVCDGSGKTCTHPAGNAGAVCRAAAGACDVAETCAGTDATCPADGKKASGTACTDDGNTCTVDQCDGSANTCQHAAGNAGAVCRAAAGECDTAETCTGTSTTCPADAKQPDGTACTDDGNPCTLDRCDGSAGTCQHPAGNAGTVCRAAAGECDVTETCTGTSTTCPADALQPNGTACTDDGNPCTVDQCNGDQATCLHPGGNSDTICRPAVDECDVPDTCAGKSGHCAADAKKPAGTACTEDGNACTLDQCNGTANTCQHPAGNAGTVCRAAAGDCDVAEFCDGSHDTCPADAFEPATTECRAAAGECDVAEHCTGNGVGCPADAVKPLDSTCSDDGTVCTRDVCDGSGKSCTHPAGNAGTVCRPGSGDLCDPEETCTGSDAACPADVLQPSTFVCRPGSGDLCDPYETCTWMPGVVCPADVIEPAGMPCRVSAGVCDPEEMCTGAAGATCPSDKVDMPPTASTGGPYRVDEGGAIAVSGTGSSPEGHSVTSAWDLDDDGTFEIADASATFFATTYDGPDTRTLAFRVCDTTHDACCTTASTTADILDVAPQATFTASTSVDEGDPIALSLTAVSDPSTADTAAGFTYEFDCGDGSGYGMAGPTTSADCPTGDNGTRTVKGRVCDKNGECNEYALDVTIDNVAPSVAVTTSPAPSLEGEPVTVQADFSDKGASDTPFACTIDFGDGPGGPVPGTVSGTSCTGSHAYDDNRAEPYVVEVCITDKDGAQGCAQTTQTVQNAKPKATMSLPQRIVYEGMPFTLALTDPEDAPADTAAGFTYAFDCGDGFNGFGPASSWTCFTDDGNTRHVRLSIMDKDGAASTYEADVLVNDKAPTASFNFTGRTTVNEGDPVALFLDGADDASSRDREAGFHYVLTCDGEPGVTLAPATYANTATNPNSVTCTYDDGDTEHVVVGRIIDKDGMFSEYTVNVGVLNVPPTPTIEGAPTASPEGAPIPLTSAVTDPSTADVTAGFTYAWSVTKNGDPFGSVGADSAFAFTPDDNGTYVVTLTVTDKDGGARSETKTVAATNLKPTATFWAPSAVNEGGAIPISLPGAVDPSAVDAGMLVYAFDCGDGAGYGAFGPANAVTCPTYDSGSRIVGGTVCDKDGGCTEYTRSVVIDDVAPQAEFNGPTTVDEHAVTVYWFSNQYDPSGVDTSVGFHYAYECDGGSLAGATYATSDPSAIVSCMWDDGPSDHLVRARIIDANDGYTEYTVSVRVSNVAPRAVLSMNRLARGDDDDHGDCRSDHRCGDDDHRGDDDRRGDDRRRSDCHGSPGSPVRLTLSSASDPSVTDIGAGFHHAFSCVGGPLVGATYANSGPSPSTLCTYPAPGIYTVRSRIIDKDGGYSEYTLVLTIGGKMTGGGSIGTLKHALELRCDGRGDDNHLEIGWPGYKFRLDKLSSATCSNDPLISPAPPAAFFDTFSGEGTGRLNNVRGATVSFTFTDAGEPGRNDTLALVVKNEQGTTVLALPASKLTGGNQQAHNK